LLLDCFVDSVAGPASFSTCPAAMEWVVSLRSTPAVESRGGWALSAATASGVAAMVGANPSPLASPSESMASSALTIISTASVIG